MIHYKEERPKQSGDWLMLRRLGSYIKPHGKLLIVAALFLAVSLARIKFTPAKPAIKLSLALHSQASAGSSKAQS